MRQVVLDTETTGLSWEKGNRVVEIGCVELVERRPTGRTFQRYLNPECPFEPGAQEVTGLTLEFLADKPKFAEVVDEFLAFIGDAELVIHNAAFDLGFLDAELGRIGPHLGRVRDRCGVEDSLELARQRFPGQRNSLDALCRRLGVDNSHRHLHGALLDAQLLAEVYLAMTRGQETLIIDMHVPSLMDATRNTARDSGADGRPRYIVHCVVPDAAELAAHRAYLEALASESKSGCLWLEVEREAALDQRAGALAARAPDLRVGRTGGKDGFGHQTTPSIFGWVKSISVNPQGCMSFLTRLTLLTNTGFSASSTVAPRPAS